MMGNLVQLRHLVIVLLALAPWQATPGSSDGSSIAPPSTLMTSATGRAGIVIEAVISLALCLDLLYIVGVTPGGDSRSIDDGNNRVNRAKLLDLGPVEGLYQRLWQGKAGSFDENVIDIVTALNQLFHYRQELFLDRATDTTIGQFIDTIFTAALEQFC